MQASDVPSTSTAHLSQNAEQYSGNNNYTATPNDSTNVQNLTQGLGNFSLASAAGPQTSVPRSLPLPSQSFSRNVIRTRDESTNVEKFDPSLCHLR